MKQYLYLLACFMVLSTVLSACNPETKFPQTLVPPTDEEGTAKPADPSAPGNKIRIVIGSLTFTATLVESSTTTALKQLLPQKMNMTEMNGNEYYTHLSSHLPVTASVSGTIQTGDIMLFGTSTLVLFYKDFITTYNYTQVGKIDNTSGLETALSHGYSNVQFELITE